MHIPACPTKETELINFQDALEAALPMVLVASRHSARRSGVWGANLQNVPLEQVPLAGSTPLKGRQPEFYKYQTG